MRKDGKRTRLLMLDYIERVSLLTGDCLTSKADVIRAAGLTDPRGRIVLAQMAARGLVTIELLGGHCTRFRVTDAGRRFLRGVAR